MTTGQDAENLRQAHLYSLNLDALLTGVKTTGELEVRLKAVLSEASAGKDSSILFVDQLSQFVGKRAAQAVSETLTSATIGGKVRLIGATSRGSYDEYIAGDAKLDGLFQQVNLDDFNSANVSEASDDEDAAGTSDNGFQGEKISADLRQLMQSGGATDRVSVIHKLTTRRAPS